MGQCGIVDNLVWLCLVGLQFSNLVYNAYHIIMLCPPSNQGSTEIRKNKTRATFIISCIQKTSHNLFPLDGSVCFYLHITLVSGGLATFITD